MPKTLHAVNYLADPGQFPPQPVCAFFGDESFLKRRTLLEIRRAVLDSDEGDFSLSSFEGKTSLLRDVLDELSTPAMFGAGRRLIVVEEADEFVTRYRAELEGYVAKPRRTGVLVLDLKSFPANTRLYKAVAATGLLVDCSPPATATATKWLRSWAEQAHGFHLDPSAADALLEAVGPELGLLDQELAKLALAVPAGGRVAAHLVAELVGSWRSRTTWEMLDAAMDGNVREALLQLDRLLLAGEHPIALLGQISATLRRLAGATQLVRAAEASGRRIALGDALQKAGVKSFVLEKAQRQLRRLGRHRAERLYGWLLQTDLDLKGASSLSPRVVLERLVVRLAASPTGQVSANVR
jgi:DNA polymerase-3 subunit delta